MDKNILLVINQSKAYLIENKCGHFGTPFFTLQQLNARLENNEIVCSEHGISFDLKTGHIVNRPYENCDPIKIPDFEIINNKIYLVDSF